MCGSFESKQTHRDQSCKNELSDKHWSGKNRVRIHQKASFLENSVLYVWKFPEIPRIYLYLNWIRAYSANSLSQSTCHKRSAAIFNIELPEAHKWLAEKAEMGNGLAGGSIKGFEELWHMSRNQKDQMTSIFNMHAEETPKKAMISYFWLTGRTHTEVKRRHRVVNCPGVLRACPDTHTQPTAKARDLLIQIN